MSRHRLPSDREWVWAGCLPFLVITLFIIGFWTGVVMLVMRML